MLSLFLMHVSLQSRLTNTGKFQKTMGIASSFILPYPAGQDQLYQGEHREAWDRSACIGLPDVQDIGAYK